MEVYYERQMRHNYLIIKQENSCEESYESQMLMANTIDGLLKFRFRQTENGVLYYYEITSKQPLTRLLEGRWIGKDEIAGLIVSIARILERIECYLLQESQILLEPEYIYVTPEDFKIYLCVVPGRKIDFPKAMEQLLQYILKKVDHKEKDSVLLAYRLYQESQKELYGMDNLLKWLSQETKAVGREEEKRDFASQIADLDNPMPETTEFLPLEYGKEVKPKQQKKKTAFWKRIPVIIGILMTPGVVWLIKGTGFFKEYPLLLAAWYGMWGIFGLALWIIRCIFSENVEEEREETKQLLFKAKEEHSWEIPSLSEEPSLKVGEGSPSTDSVIRPVTAPVMETQLLTPENVNQKIVRYLVSLDKQQEDIPIPYFPFIIGKKSGITDYTLNKDTVSRLHVKLEEIDGGYQITDLNSTNGTMVKGVMLQNNETKFLEIGDEIYIADSGFRFM